MKQVALHVWFGVLVVGLSHCYSKEDDGTALDGPIPPNTIDESQIGTVCDPSLVPPSEGMHRLTTSQYLNAVGEFANWALKDPKAADAVQALATVRAVPADVREKTPEDVHGSYRRLDQSLQSARLEAYYKAGVEVGRYLTTNGNLAKLAGTCATDGNASNDATCLDDFIRKYGERLLRRPIVDADVSFYRGVYGTGVAPDPEAYADVLGVMLNTPDFLYTIESGEGNVTGKVVKLSALELAARLSFHLWDSPPDDVLLQAAKSGELLTDAGYQKQVDRMLNDERTQKSFGQFFLDWVKAEDLPALNLRNQEATFRTFAGDNLPTEELRAEMIQDALDTFQYVSWSSKGKLSDLFTTDINVNRGAELAKIYGAAPWNGTQAPGNFGGLRPGLFTRGLFLATGSATTRPIMRGVLLRKQVLCDTLGSPPAGVNLTPPELRPDMTTREVVENVTEQPGTSCAGCHATSINPIGFALEGFDSLGRYRTEQTLFNADGSVATKKRVRTDSIPRVELDDQTPVSGASEMMQRFAASRKPAVCLARNYFRFTYGRFEKAGDSCAVKRTGDALQAGSITDALRTTVMDQQFRERTME